MQKKYESSILSFGLILCADMKKCYFKPGSSLNKYRYIVTKLILKMIQFERILIDIFVFCSYCESKNILHFHIKFDQSNEKCISSHYYVSQCGWPPDHELVLPLQPPFCARARAIAVL